MNELNHPISRMVQRIAEAICLSSVRPVVEEGYSSGSLCIRITTAPSDYGAVCGRAGVCVKSLKEIVSRAGEKAAVAAEVHLEEPAALSGPDIRVGIPMPVYKKQIEAMVGDALALTLDPGRYKVEPRNGRIFVQANGADVPIVVAIGNVFYIVAKRHGLDVKVRPEGIREARIP